MSLDSPVDIIIGSETLTGANRDLARIFHDSPTATADKAVLPATLGPHTLRRTVQVRLESETLRLPGGTAASAVSRRRFMKYAG